jgi:hypothetical protein
MIELLRAPDDDRADSAHRAEVMARAAQCSPTVAYRVVACVGCHSITLWTATRCLQCEEDHDWAEGNRAICSWVHRDAPGRA